MIPPAARMGGLPPRDTSEMMSPPPSVTEDTTKRLELEEATKYLETPAKQLKLDAQQGRSKQ